MARVFLFGLIYMVFTLNAYALDTDRKFITYSNPPEYLQITTHNNDVTVMTGNDNQYHTFTTPILNLVGAIVNKTGQNNGKETLFVIRTKSDVDVKYFSFGKVSYYKTKEITLLSSWSLDSEFTSQSDIANYRSFERAFSDFNAVLRSASTGVSTGNDQKRESVKTIKPSTSSTKDHSSIKPVESSKSSKHEYQKGGEFNYCVEEFYDRDMYNWYSFKNKCSEPVNIVYRSRNGSTGIRGATDLKSGRKESIGASKKEVSKADGVISAICRIGFIPVDENDNYWKGGQFRCKKELYPMP